jgi:hypothetical protein
MHFRRRLIASYRTFLLTSAATLAMFLPAAVSMNSVYPSGDWKKFRPAAFTAPTPRSVAPAQHNDIHARSLKKTKGGLALQTAAVVGSSAVAAAANLVSRKPQSIIGYNSHPLQKLSARQSLK